jgi:hypothetical protein
LATKEKGVNIVCDDSVDVTCLIHGSKLRLSLACSLHEYKNKSMKI